VLEGGLGGTSARRDGAATGRTGLRLALMLTGDAHLAQDLAPSALASAFRRWSRVEAADAPQAYVRQILVREHLLLAPAG
jgi:DNA-directed RNA polymerase specialized sigma24 family protein